MSLEFILYTKGNAIEGWKLYEEKRGYLKELLQYSMGFGKKMISTQQRLINNVNFSYSFTIF
jgi:hypothetical protein